MRSRRQRLMRQASVAFAALVLVAVFALFALPLTPRVRAQGPLGDAMQTIVAVTVEARETSDAQAAQAASQRATSAALSLQMQQAAATATRAALLQQAADAQATRAAESAAATETAIARATALALQVQATATEQARRVMAQQAQDAQATADAQATRAEATRAANATRTAFALATDAARRDAQFRSALSVSGIVVLWALAALLLAVFWRLLRVQKKPVTVEIVEDRHGADGTPLAARAGVAAEDAERPPLAADADDLGAPHTIVLSGTPEARALAELIAREMGDVLPEQTDHVEPNSTSTQ